MSTKAAAVSAAQTLLRDDGANLVVDGSWGERTEAAFASASTLARARVVAQVASMGWDVTELRPRKGGSKDRLIRVAMADGVTGSSLANLLATVEAESGFIPRRERHYYSDVSRARDHFGALRGYTDEQIVLLREKGPREWFNVVYGPKSKKGRELGNTMPDDGFDFRGGGEIQLTGRSNYTAFRNASGIDVVNNPNLILDPDVSARAAVWFWKTFVMSRGWDTTMSAATKVVNAGLKASEVSKRVLIAQRYQRELV